MKGVIIGECHRMALLAPADEAIEWRFLPFFFGHGPERLFLIEHIPPFPADATGLSAFADLLAPQDTSMPVRLKDV
jgi:hypothetical protein